MYVCMYLLYLYYRVGGMDCILEMYMRSLSTTTTTINEAVLKLVGYCEWDNEFSKKMCRVECKEYTSIDTRSSMVNKGRRQVHIVVVHIQLIHCFLPVAHRNKKWIYTNQVIREIHTGRLAYVSSGRVMEEWKSNGST